MKRKHKRHHEPAQKLAIPTGNICSAGDASGLHPAPTVAPPPAPSYWASLLLIVVCLALASAQGK